jgi:Fic family protein
MIRSVITNDILKGILFIEHAKDEFGGIRIPVGLSGKLRKSSRKKSSLASAKIEGNPLTEEQASAAIDSSKRHYLKPEQEVRNYFAALEYLDKCLAERRPISKELILDVQRIVVKGESAEKTGFRGPMPAGFLFGVYDDATGRAEYIPPESKDIEPLVDELVRYTESTDDHPVIQAAIVHYQLVTIHPFEDGNGRTARLISDYVLDRGGYGFGGIGSLEEYFAYDIDEYYRSLQMGLPPLCYEGRLDPPHPEIWLSYFVRMMELRAGGVKSLLSSTDAERETTAKTHLSIKESRFLDYLRQHDIRRFSPSEVAADFGVTNRTVINWCAALVRAGVLAPDFSGSRIRSFTLVANMADKNL